MPALLTKLKEWREFRPIGHFFSEVTPGPSYLIPDIFGNIFAEDFEQILELMPEDTEQDRMSKKYMQGIANRIANSQPNADEIANLQIYLREKDRRRNTSWQTTFPWIEKYKQYVV